MLIMLPQMKKSLARWLLLLLGFLILGVVGSLILQRRTVAQDIPGGGRARLIFPIYWTQAFGSTVILEGETGRRAELFYGLFETPLMLLPGQRPATAICIYMFDIKDAVFVFDLKGRWSPHPPARGEEDFDFMVPNSALPFRKADPEELRYALAAVRAMSESAYESASASTLDLGWYRWYADRQAIEKTIEDKLQEESKPQ